MSTINAAVENMGNAVVAKQIKDGGQQKLHEPLPIRVERIDSISETENQGWNVPLMKMGVQGLECHVVNGIGAAKDSTRNTS
jgi:hypothetical protein